MVDMNEQSNGKRPSAQEPFISTSKPVLDLEVPDPDEDDLDDLDGTYTCLKAMRINRRLRYIRAS